MKHLTVNSRIGPIGPSEIPIKKLSKPRTDSSDSAKETEIPAFVFILLSYSSLAFTNSEF